MVRIMKRLLILFACMPALAGAQSIKFENFPIGTTPVGTDYTWCDQGGVSNRCTFSSVATGVSTLLGLGTFATANAATPPAIGGTTPNAGSFTTLNLSGALTTDILGLTQCLHVNSAGVVSGTGVDCGAGGGGGAFSAITSGANTTATMQVGTGATLEPTGSGILVANSFSGTLGTANGGTGASSLSGAFISIYSGGITSGHCAQWSATGILVDSGGGCGSGGSNAFSALTSSTNTTAAMVVGTGASLAVSGSGTIAATNTTGVNGASVPASAAIAATNSSSQVIAATTTGSGTTAVLSVSPALTTPSLGVATATSINGVTIPSVTDTTALLGQVQTFTAANTFTNSDLKLLGSSSGATTFTSANASSTNYTATVPANTGTLAETNLAGTWSAVQTFTNSDMCLLGSSTGCSTFTSANASATNYTITFPAASFTVGYLNVPQNAQSTVYTLALTDEGGEVYNTDTSANTITIPANASVAFPIGTCIVITGAPTAAAATIAITTDTLYWSPSGTTGSRTLAPFGEATVCKKAATVWYISGSGIT